MIFIVRLNEEESQLTVYYKPVDGKWQEHIHNLWRPDFFLSVGRGQVNCKVIMKIDNYYTEYGNAGILPEPTDFPIVGD